MKLFNSVLCAAVIILFLVGTVQAEPKYARYTVYNAKEKCYMVCKAPKPALEILEDGLAYVLDIPLAIISPITCPVVRPVLDRFDSDESRTYKTVKVRR